MGLRTPILQNSLDKINHLLINNSTAEWMEQCILDNDNTESCGFLVGTFQKDNALVERAIFTKNISESSDYFAISPQDYTNVLKTIKEREQLIGIFHSHKKTPQPSPKDVENMKLYPLIWLIFGYIEEGTRRKLERIAYKPLNGKVTKVTIKILRKER